MFSRRGFLKAFGITTATTLVKPTEKTLSLFGSDKAKAATSAMGYHIVVLSRPVRKKASGQVSVQVSNPQENTFFEHKAEIIGTVQPQFPTVQPQFPKVVGVSPEGHALIRPRTWILEDLPEDDEIRIEVTGEGDPYIGFYKASEQIRQKIRERSIQRVQNISGDLRGRYKLLSVVHSPIHARPIPGGKGFEVYCDLETRLVPSVNLDGWEVYSQFGEIPVQVPSEIEMETLLQYDADIVNRTGKGWARYQSSGLDISSLE